MALAAALNKGGKVQKFDNGGQAIAPFQVQSPVLAQPVQPMATDSSKPKSKAGQYLKGASSAAPNIGSTGGNTGGGQYLEQGVSQGLATLGQALAQNRTQAPGQSQLVAGGPMDAGNPAPDTMFAAKGGSVGDRLKKGGKVPGKPKVPGAVNTEKNDTVPALLSAGEIVLPRSVTQSSDPAGNAQRFVQAIMAKKGQMPRKAA